MKRTILIAVLLLSASTTFAADRLVPSQYATIQAAIDDCNDGDTVIVAPGTYMGDGNRDIDFNGKAITVRSTDPCDPDVVAATIIDCNGSAAEPHRGFSFGPGEDANSVIDGLSITNGYIPGSGGGIYCYDSSPTIANCTIYDNYASGSGGGIYCEYSSNPTIINCTFSGNSAGDRGGGMFNDNSSPTLTNCTFSGNSASNEGGGIFCDNSYLMRLANCILWGNTDSGGTDESAQIYRIYGGEPEVIFSCIQDNDPNDGNVPFGGESNGNIDDDPMFVRNPDDGGDGWGVGDNDDFGDLHLQNGSPCIEAGFPDFSGVLNSVDIDGQPRVIGRRIDMGVDEFAPMIVVTKPQGGEVWGSGSKHEINWLSYGVSGTVDISYSSNNGAEWVAIENSAADSGSYIWHLPDIVDSNQCLISVVPSVPDSNVVSIESGVFTIHPGSPDPVVASNWKSLGGDFGRTGLSENYGPELGCVKWQFETDGPVTASVTIGHNNRVYIACEDGKLYTLDAGGSLLWSYDTNSPLVSSPTIGLDGTVYVGSQSGKLYAIDIDGNLRWVHNTDGFIYSSPAVSTDGKVYACSQDGILYALGQDGSELWSFETGGFGELGGSIFASPAVGEDGTVYIAGLYDPNLYALNPDDGSLKWACNFEFLIDPSPEMPEGGTKAGWPFASPVVAPDGTIYQTLLYDPNLYAIDPNGGSIIWATDLADPDSGWFDSDYDDTCYPIWFRKPGCYYADRYGHADGWSEPALGPDGTIYVSFDDPYLRAVDPNGSIKWVTQLGMKGGFTLTVGGDGLIYAASDDGYLCVINASGEEIARFQSDDWLNLPVITAGNTIIVSDGKDNTMLISDANNTVWAIGPDSCEGQASALHRPEDLDTGRTVDFIDFAMLAADWLDCTDTYMYMDPEGGERQSHCDYDGDEMYLTGDIDRNQYVDFADLAVLVNQWLSEE